MSKPYILLVDDDISITNLISKKLDSSFNFFIAETISESKYILKHKHIDAICLDLMLPDGYGLQYCRKIKTQYSNIKIIILTKRIYLKDRLESFKYGADDYLSKPFFPEELEARINKILNRNNNENIFDNKGIELNFTELYMKYKNVKVFLSYTEMNILYYLLAHERTVSNKELIKYLETKRDKDINRNAFTVSVNRLKYKLKKNIGMEIIKSRYGLGYYIGI